jgi:arylsulfatase A-like enzyme
MKSMRRKTNALLIFVLAAALSIVCSARLPAAEADTQRTAQSTQGPSRLKRPIPEVERVLLISIDGCRPDVLLRADVPNLRRLMKTGSYSFWARTVPVAVTLPSHASMLTGVTPDKHGITFNSQKDEDAEVARPKVPTIFELAMRYGMGTAVVAGKSKFDAFARIGHIGRSWTKAAEDDKVADQAVRMAKDYRPEVLFVHFPGCDKAGHKYGWAGPEQVKALEKIDAQIGKVVAAIDELGDRDKTVVLVTADHGGAGRGHGIAGGGAAPDDPRSQHIPWIISGPGIRQDYDLSRDPGLKITTMDTFATLCYLLGIQPEGSIDGKPVMLAVQERQLLQDSK